MELLRLKGRRVQACIQSESLLEEEEEEEECCRGKDMASDPGPVFDAPPFRPSIQEAGVLSQPVP